MPGVTADGEHAPDECVAIIPARGGSKGVPGKNLLRLGGDPLVARAVRAATMASAVYRVVFSTDDKEIAAAALDAGAEVLERPPHLAGDSVASESVLLHALDELRAIAGRDPEILAFIQCTSPLIDPSDIDQTVALVRSGTYDTALTVAPSHRFMWRNGPHGAVGVNHDPQRRLLRQQRDQEFVETGAVYAMRVAGFRDHRHRFFGRIGLHVVPPERSHEIDEPSDVDIARALVERARSDDQARRLPARVDALALDFDGVLTDNRVIVDERGTESVVCDRGDGLGIGRLRAAGVRVVVISKERNPVVEARCRKLDIECIQAVDDKVEVLTGWLARHRVDPAACVYVGNDLNDLGCLAAVGCGVAVADAAPEVFDHAAIVLRRPGGSGAVRELCDLILSSRTSEETRSLPA